MNEGIFLQSAELAYLMGLFEAKTVVGVDNNSLFPKLKTAQEALYAEGFHALQANGWLVPVGKEQKLKMDKSVLLMATIIADPDLAIISTRLSSDGGHQSVVHYLLNNSILELVYTNDARYRLGYVEDFEDMVGRLQATLPIPALTSLPTEPMVLSKGRFAQLKGLVNAGNIRQGITLLAEDGILPEQSQIFVASLLDHQKQAIVQIKKLQAGQVVAGKQMVLFSGDKYGWFMDFTDTGDEKLLFLPAAHPTFSHWLHEAQQKLKG